MQLICFLQSTQSELSEKKWRQPDRHNYLSKRNKATNVQSKPSSLTEINEVLQQATTIDKTDLVDISSSDSEDNDQENIDVSESENCSNIESASSSNEADSDTDWNLKLSLVLIYTMSLIDSKLIAVINLSYQQKDFVELFWKYIWKCIQLSICSQSFDTDLIFKNNYIYEHYE